MGEDSWKSGLSSSQLAKISQLENQRDGFKSELAKKAYNFDILQQNLEKEKRKVSCKRYNTKHLIQNLVTELKNFFHDIDSLWKNCHFSKLWKTTKPLT